DFPSPFESLSSPARYRTAIQAKVKRIDKITIIGAGSWGTALAWLWGKDGRQIYLWGNNAGRVERMLKTRENSDYIPGLKLPDSVKITHELGDCADADLVVFVTPSIVLRAIAMRLQGALSNHQAVFLSCTKGIEHGTGMRMSEIIAEIFPGHKPQDVLWPDRRRRLNCDLFQQAQPESARGRISRARADNRANYFRDANDSGRNSHDRERLRMRAKAEPRLADH